MFETVQWIVRIALALALVGMGVTHFLPKPARGMAAMIPRVLHRGSLPRVLVIFTGLCEIAGGIGLLWEPVRFAAGTALIVFLIAVFPANVVAARQPEKFGALAIPFWPRYVGQVVLIAFVVVAMI